MEKEHLKIITDKRNDFIDLRHEFFLLKESHKLQLLSAQSDFFKTLSTLIVAFISIGWYLYAENFDSQFLFISFCLSSVVFILSISHTRETIDKSSNYINEAEKGVRSKVEEVMEKIDESIEKDDSNIFFEYQKKEKERLNKTTKEEPALNYIGEILVFSFYSSIAFLMLSYLGKIYYFGFSSFQTVVVLLVISILSFKDWTIKFSEILSMDIVDIKEYFDKHFRSKLNK